MSVTAPTTTRSRWPRRLAIGGGVVVVLLLVVFAPACWIFSGLLIDPHHDLTKKDVAVRAVTPATVTLERTKASARVGTYGLDWNGGHAIVTAVLAKTGDTVTRTLTSPTGAPLTTHTRVALDPDVWEGTPQTARGIPYRAVTFPDPLGPMPAWIVEPSRPRGATWVIFVHGIDGKRAAALRPLRTLQGTDLPTMIISYRNDVGAPKSPDGKIHLGMTEWQDLDAAARYAVAHGAQHLILYGQSMGGAIVTRFMHLSPLARRVTALVLDAPVLDWRSVIDHQADKLHLPFMGPPVRWTIGQRIPVSWDALDEISQAQTFRVPILLFQGLADPLVPPQDSREFAARVPDRRATFIGVPGAGHIMSWNVVPAMYDRRLGAFLQSVG